MVRRVTWLFLFFVVTQGASLWACPACRDASTQSADHNNGGIQLGFSLSVLFLMAMPLSLISAFIFWVVKLEKERTQSEENQSNQS